MNRFRYTLDFVRASLKQEPGLHSSVARLPPGQRNSKLGHRLPGLRGHRSADRNCCHPWTCCYCPPGSSTSSYAPYEWPYSWRQFCPTCIWHQRQSRSLCEFLECLPVSSQGSSWDGCRVSESHWQVSRPSGGVLPLACRGSRLVAWALGMSVVGKGTGWCPQLAEAAAAGLPTSYWGLSVFYPLAGGRQVG